MSSFQNHGIKVRSLMFMLNSWSFLICGYDWCMVSEFYLFYFRGGFWLDCLLVGLHPCQEDCLYFSHRFCRSCFILFRKYGFSTLLCVDSNVFSGFTYSIKSPSYFFYYFPSWHFPVISILKNSTMKPFNSMFGAKTIYSCTTNGFLELGKVSIQVL